MKWLMVALVFFLLTIIGFYVITTIGSFAALALLVGKIGAYAIFGTQLGCLVASNICLAIGAKTFNSGLDSPPLSPHTQMEQDIEVLTKLDFNVIPKPVSHIPAASPPLSARSSHLVTPLSQERKEGSESETPEPVFRFTPPGGI